MLSKRLSVPVDVSAQETTAIKNSLDRFWTLDAFNVITPEHFDAMYQAVITARQSAPTYTGTVRERLHTESRQGFLKKLAAIIDSEYTGSIDFTQDCRKWYQEVTERAFREKAVSFTDTIETPTPADKSTLTRSVLLLESAHVRTGRGTIGTEHSGFLYPDTITAIVLKSSPIGGEDTVRSSEYTSKLLDARSAQELRDVNDSTIFPNLHGDQRWDWEKKYRSVDELCHSLRSRSASLPVPKAAAVHQLRLAVGDLLGVELPKTSETAKALKQLLEYLVSESQTEVPSCFNLNQCCQMDSSLKEKLDGLKTTFPCSELLASISRKGASFLVYSEDYFTRAEQRDREFSALGDNHRQYLEKQRQGELIAPNRHWGFLQEPTAVLVATTDDGIIDAKKAQENTRVTLTNAATMLLPTYTYDPVTGRLEHVPDLESLSSKLRSFYSSRNTIYQEQQMYPLAVLKGSVSPIPIATAIERLSLRWMSEELLLNEVAMSGSVAAKMQVFNLVSESDPEPRFFRFLLTLLSQSHGKFLKRISSTLEQQCKRLPRGYSPWDDSKLNSTVTEMLREGTLDQKAHTLRFISHVLEAHPAAKKMTESTRESVLYKPPWRDLLSMSAAGTVNQLLSLIEDPDCISSRSLDAKKHLREFLKLPTMKPYLVFFESRLKAQQITPSKVFL